MLGFVATAALCLSLQQGRAAENVLLTEVPDYDWHVGCFGTASGNLMGFWDRHGFPDFYTGPTGNGVAPLDSRGENQGIRSMWASQAGFDGRPLEKNGHIDDYWTFYSGDFFYSYESTAPDPYLVAGRPEHEPDCIGDFIGLSQNKWTNLNGECDGNIDGFSFVFWDATGARRTNFVPSENGVPIPDIPSGLRAWTQFRGYDAEVFSQLTDFNPHVAPGHGFTFDDLKAEIDSGYPVLLFLQLFDQPSRKLPGMSRGNPFMHGMLAHGYYVADSGAQYVRYKTSWGGSGDNTFSRWDGDLWQADLPVRGVIGYRPVPRIRNVVPAGGSVRIEWDGPSAVLSNVVSRTSRPAHWYLVEKSTRLDADAFVPAAEPTTLRSVTIADCCADEAFFRVRLISPPDSGG